MDRDLEPLRSEIAVSSAVSSVISISDFFVFSRAFVAVECIDSVGKGSYT